MRVFKNKLSNQEIARNTIAICAGYVSIIPLIILSLILYRGSINYSLFILGLILNTPTTLFLINQTRSFSKQGKLKVKKLTVFLLWMLSTFGLALTIVSLGTHGVKFFPVLILSVLFLSLLGGFSFQFLGTIYSALVLIWAEFLVGITTDQKVIYFAIISSVFVASQLMVSPIVGGLKAKNDVLFKLRGLSGELSQCESVTDALNLLAKALDAMLKLKGFQAFIIEGSNLCGVFSFKSAEAACDCDYAQAVLESANSMSPKVISDKAVIPVGYSVLGELVILLSFGKLTWYMRSILNDTLEFVGSIFTKFNSRFLYHQKIIEESRVDSLTGLLNKKTFEEILNLTLEMAKRHGIDVGLLILDIDHFKHVNDAIGHIEADKMLQEVVSTLNQNLRQTDVFARYGGDEFCVLLSHSSLIEALKTAEKIRKLVEKSFLERKLSISIGVAGWDFNEDAETLKKRADIALYRAKALGRNRVEFSLSPEPSLDQSAYAFF